MIAINLKGQSKLVSIELATTLVLKKSATIESEATMNILFLKDFGGKKKGEVCNNIDIRICKHLIAIGVCEETQLKVVAASELMKIQDEEVKKVLKEKTKKVKK